MKVLIFRYCDLQFKNTQLDTTNSQSCLPFRSKGTTFLKQFPPFEALYILKLAKNGMPPLFYFIFLPKFHLLFAMTIYSEVHKHS